MKVVLLPDKKSFCLKSAGNKHKVAIIKYEISLFSLFEIVGWIRNALATEWWDEKWMKMDENGEMRQCLLG